MDNNINVELYYGYQECEDGIYHAFSLEDPKKAPNADNIADELASLLDTTPEDQRFNWNVMEVRLPDTVVEQIRNSGVQMAVESMKPAQPKKVYTINSFRKTLYDRVIEATGRVTTSGKVDDCINYSSILTKLIQVAGRLVDRYASDLLISWNSVLRDLEFACGEVCKAQNDTEVYQNHHLFGFREMGVDHTTAVLARYNNGGPGYYGRDYRELWRLNYSVAGTGEVKMSLFKVEKAV